MARPMNGFFDNVCSSFKPFSIGNQRTQKLLFVAGCVALASFVSTDNLGARIQESVSGQPFEMLLSNSEIPEAHTCELNAPLSTKVETTLATLAVCPAAECPVTSPVAGNHYVVANSNSRNIDQYCSDVAELLTITLNGSVNSPAAQKRTIQAALKMVAEHTSSVTQGRIEKDKLPLQITDSQTVEIEIETESDQLESLYATQYRNSQQIKSLIESNQTLGQSLAMMQLKLEKFAMLQRAKVSDSEVRRMISSVEFNELREQEIQRLKSELRSLDVRIEELQIHKPTPIQPMQAQPASHLEPVYRPERRLTPLQRSQTMRR